MSKPTPGPWTTSDYMINARYLNGIGDVVLIRRDATDDDRNVALATVDGMGFDLKVRTSLAEQKANAVLLAAAPDMLAALEKIVSMNRDHALEEFGDSDKAESWGCVKVARAAIAKAEGR